jgi:hypothetical protein
VNPFHGDRTGCSAPHVIFSPLKSRGQIAQSVLLVHRPAIKSTPAVIPRAMPRSVGFTLFVHGALWWLGLVIAVIALAVLVVGNASLVVAPAARHEFLRLSRNLGDARATAWDARPCGHIGL